MKKLILIIIALIACRAGAQGGVKIGLNPTANTVSAVLELESVTKGFLPPRLTSAQMNAITTPAAGLVVYCTDCTPKSLWQFDGTAWGPVGGVPVPTVVANCTGFEGAFASGVLLTGASFKVTVTNNSFFAASPITLNTTDLALSGVAGITVTGIQVDGVTTSTMILGAGATSIVTYLLSGTPTTTGTLTGSWSKVTLSCTKTKTVGTLSSLLATNYCTTTAALNGNYIKDAPMVAATNTFTVTLNNTSGFPLNNLTAPSAGNLVLSGAGAAGLTVASVSPSGTFSLAVGASQTITYTLSGTPTTNGAVTAAWGYYDLSCSKTRTVAGLSTAVNANYCTNATVNGNYINGVAFTGTNTFQVTIQNTSGMAINGLAAPTAGNLGLTWTGTGTLSVASVTPNTTFSLGVGASQVITYTLTGTPTSSGTLTATWNYNDLTCPKIKTITDGTATFTLPQNVYVTSITNVTPLVNVQGIIDNTSNKITFSVPYTGGAGGYPAYSGSSILVNGQGGDTNNLSISYPAGTFSATGNLTVTVVVDGDGTFNVTKQGIALEAVVASLSLVVSGNTIGNLIINAFGGVRDRKYGDGTHNFIYVPVVAEDGKKWLSNNLGANYAKVGHPAYSPGSQATGPNDYNAFGSMFQWGRDSDGHEIYTYGGIPGPGATVTTANGVIDGMTGTDTPNNTTLYTTTSSHVDWRNPHNDNLWQGLNGINNPCPVGYRLPTVADWTTLRAAGGYNDYPTSATKILKLPSPAFRRGTSTAAQIVNTGGEYWTSTIGTEGIYTITKVFYPPAATGFASEYRCYSVSVRCISE